METNTIDNIDLTKLFDKQCKRSHELRTESIKKRKERLRKLKKWILDNRGKIQEALYKDFKKPPSETDLTEIATILLEINHNLSKMDEWARDERVDGHITFLGSKAYVQYEPKGVCLIIAPWNYPFQLMLNPLISAIAAGNTAILKPSEITTNNAALVSEMVNELFDESEVAVIEGGVQVTTDLLELPFDHIFFTGSPNVGKIIMQAAAKNLTSVTLELGGKSPVIVDESANLKDAASRIAWGKLLNNGQTCVAPDYMLVHSSIKDKLVVAIKEEMIKQFGEGNDDFQKSDSYARIVNDRHYERLSSIIEDSINQGFDILYGGKTNSEDRFISPTIIDGFEGRLAEDELFGPVMGLKTFDNLDEVVEIVNSKPKPLSLYVFSRRKKNKKFLLDRLSAGTVAINDTVQQQSHPNLPFGGVNNSGIGKSHGKYGFLAFSNEKAVLVQRSGLTNISMLRPPYGKAKKIIDLFINFILK